MLTDSSRIISSGRLVYGAFALVGTAGLELGMGTLHPGISNVFTLALCDDPPVRIPFPHHVPVLCRSFPAASESLFDGLLCQFADRNYNVPLEGLRSGLPKTHPAVLHVHRCRSGDSSVPLRQLSNVCVHGELVGLEGVEPSACCFSISVS